MPGSGTSPARPHRHALAETVAEYGSAHEARAHTKLSISLPADLVEQVRLAAAEAGTSVSGVIAAALDRMIASSDQRRLDAAVAAQNEENLAWAEAFLPLTSKLWPEVEWQGSVGSRRPPGRAEATSTSWTSGTSVAT